MTRKSWKQIEAGLAGQHPKKVSGQEAFWSDFKARVRLYPQHEKTPENAVTPWRTLRWASVAAVLLLIAAFVVRQFSVNTAPAACAVSDVEVVVPYSALLIMEDELTQSTILWIVDMELTEEGGNA